MRDCLTPYQVSKWLSWLSLKWLILAFNNIASYTLTIRASIKRGEKMAATATLSSKYQISVPKAIRDDLHWEAGQEFVFIPKGKGVLLMPVPELEQLAGIAKGARTEGYRDRQDRF